MSFRSNWLKRLLQDRLLVLLVLLLLPLLAATSLPAAAIVELVHWQTLAALTGLMILSRALDDSGYLTLAGRWLLLTLKSERCLAAALVMFAAALSAVVTNDVALFIMIPLTLGLRGAGSLPIARLVIFQAFAVNAGSSLSPIGNPQNLYLWQHSGVSFLHFIQAMLPISTALMVLLIGAIPLAFQRRQLVLSEALNTAPRNRPLLLLAMLLYPVFLLMIERNVGELALLALLIIMYITQRQVLRGVDWALLLIFLLMFIDLGLLAQLTWLQAALLPYTENPDNLLMTTLLVSQLISNVPATLLLSHYSSDWQTLAWGASVGGFGTAIGSLANLIALRLARLPGIWADFHRWSFAMLLAGALIAVAIH